MMMMAALQRTKAQLVIVVCASILTSALFLPRLALKMAAHDKLKASHEALKKQAEGLAAEYSRATKTSTSSDGNGIGEVTADEEVAHLSGQVKNLLKANQQLSEEVQKAEEAQQKSELSLSAVTTQYKNLEASYDELLERIRGLEVENGKLGGSGLQDKKAD